MGKYDNYTADWSRLPDYVPPYNLRYPILHFKYLEESIMKCVAEKVIAKEKMENKITDWVVRNQAGSVQTWHSNRNEAVLSAEKQARQYPGSRFFVCKVEPVTMSVTNNVTTTVL